MGHGSEGLWCIGWAAIIFALAHILAAVGEVKTRPTVYLLFAVSGGFVFACIKFLLWGAGSIFGG